MLSTNVPVHVSITEGSEHHDTALFSLAEGEHNGFSRLQTGILAPSYSSAYLLPNAYWRIRAGQWRRLAPGGCPLIASLFTRYALVQEPHMDGCPMLEIGRA